MVIEKYKVYEDINVHLSIFKVLPITPRASRGTIVASTVKRWSQWQHVKRLSLTINMRVVNQSNANVANSMKDYSDWLLRIGESREETTEKDGNGTYYYCVLNHC